MAVVERANEEIWELMVPGRVHVEVTNHRGRPQDLTVVGKGQRLRLSTTDREIAQERIRQTENDPFSNGMLRRVDSAAKESERAKDELTDEDLKQIFEFTGPEFEAMVEELSEMNVRRMNAMAEEVDAAASQISFLASIIERKWPIGGTVPSYEEMQRAPI